MRSALLLAGILAATPVAAPAQSGPDSAGALAAFRENLDAIHRRHRAAYLSSYLRSPALVRAGPDGLDFGYEPFAESGGGEWPDTLVASHLRVVPLAAGVVYGAYRYRFEQGDVSQRGVSERVFLRTPEGWKIAVTTAFPSPPGTPPPPYALRGATLVDGTGAPPVEGANVVMRDGRIACAGAAEGCPVPDDAAVVDARGRWVIPGLVDAHVHYSQTGWADGRPDALDVRERFPYPETVADLEARPERFYRAHLCSGVTATFDVGGYPWTWGLRGPAGESTAAPHVAAAGPLLSTIDHWVNLPAERQFIHMADGEATRRGARFLVANATDAVKVWFLRRPGMDTVRLKGVLDVAAREAREAGLPLIVHATGLWQAKAAVRAGARLLVHSVHDRPVDGEFLRLAREAGTIYTPTLIVSDGYRQLRARSFDEERYGDALACVDPGTRRKAFLTDSLGGGLAGEEAVEARERGREEYALMLDNLARVHDAGIPVATGTDAGNPLTLHGPAIYPEMEAMQEAGLSPMDVLLASTRTGARAMGRGDELGTVEPGKAADLVVLRRDPTADVANVRSVALVVRGGEIRTRAELAFAGPGGGGR